MAFAAAVVVATAAVIDTVLGLRANSSSRSSSHTHTLGSHVYLKAYKYSVLTQILSTQPTLSSSGCLEATSSSEIIPAPDP